jgi:hypothetical protein
LSTDQQALLAMQVSGSLQPVHCSSSCWLGFSFSIAFNRKEREKFFFFVFLFLIDLLSHM